MSLNFAFEDLSSITDPVPDRNGTGHFGVNKTVTVTDLSKSFFWRYRLTERVPSGFAFLGPGRET